MKHRTYSSIERGCTMQFHWKPMEAKELAHYVNHNTIVFTDKVMVHKLMTETHQTIWELDIPNEHQELVALMFDLSLSHNIIGYEIGLQYIHPNFPENTTRYSIDHIIVKESTDGTTNITGEVIDAIAERYKPL